MGILKDIVDHYEALLLSKQVEDEVINNNLELNAALRKAKEMYLGKRKSCQHTDQSNVSNLTQTYADIISPHEDIDNGEVFDIESGQTIRDLRGI